MSARGYTLDDTIRPLHDTKLYYHRAAPDSSNKVSMIYFFWNLALARLTYTQPVHVIFTILIVGSRSPRRPVRSYVWVYSNPWFPNWENFPLGENEVTSWGMKWRRHWKIYRSCFHHSLTTGIMGWWRVLQRRNGTEKVGNNWLERYLNQLPFVWHNMRE